MRYLAISTTALALLLAAGCGGKQVPAEALAQVPSARVDDLAAIQDRLAETRDRLEVTRTERERLADREASAEKQVSKLDKQRDKSQAREVDAIEAGSSSLAASEDAAVKAIDEALAEARGEWNSLADQLEERSLEVDMLEDKEVWLLAHLEAERASAAADGGAEIDVGKFQRRAEKKQANYEEARDAWIASLETEDKEQEGLSTDGQGGDGSSS